MIPTELNEHQSAFLGSPIGALVGDAAGAVLEFWGDLPAYEDVQHALGMPGGGCWDVAPGQITDDGELSIALAEALAAKAGHYDPEVVAKSYVDWAGSRPFDIGGTTSAALNHGRRGESLSALCREEARASSPESKANGALMRITPLAVASARWAEANAVRWAEFDAELTHPHITCQHANASYTLAVRHLVLHPRDHKGSIDAARRYLDPLKSEVSEWLEDALAQDLPGAQKMIGFVRHGFTRAFFHLNERSGFREALSHTLAAGGDTDTNACIVGGLMGAYWGVSRLLDNRPTAKMVHAVLDCDTSSGRHRPARYRSARMIEHLRSFM